MIAELIALVVPLGLDTFAVSCALGLTGIPAARRARLSLLMVGFEAGMPLVGLAAGAPLGHALGSASDYLAIGVLIAFGVYTLLAGDEQRGASGLLDATGWRTILLGISISLDELAVGFTFGLLRLPVIVVVAAIAIQTLVVTQLGMRLGARVGEHIQERAEQLAGVALVLLGAVLLAEKLVG